MTTFDKSVFDRKVSKLNDLSVEIEYVPSEMSRKTEWRYGPKGLHHQDAGFFKALIVRGKVKKTGFTWQQPLIVEEGQQYDETHCFNEVGHIVLPLRENEGIVEVGITVLNGPGSYGKLLFAAPRASLSNPEKVVAPNDKDVVWRKKVFTNVNRLAGQVSCFVAWERPGAAIKPKGEMVWFTLEELERLVDHDSTGDPSSNMLIMWVLANRDSLKRA